MPVSFGEAMKDKKCRFCCNNLKYTFIDLGMSPVSNAYIKREALQHKENIYPLHAYVCEKCFLVQLEEFETPDQIFSNNYAYFSSFSQSWLDHCKKYVSMIIKKLSLTENSKVIEIASNDGYLLQYFVKNNIPVLGIEPSLSVAQVAESKGINTLNDFFRVKIANKLKEKNEKADLIIGNNVLAHVPDINDFVAGIKVLLKDNGTVTLEFPHLLNLIEKNQFDTIYHEHFSYLSFYTANEIFKYHGLKLYDVEEIPTHGGSLRIYGAHIQDLTKNISQNVVNLLEKEEKFGIKNIDTYLNFDEKVKQIKKDLLEFLMKIKKEGKTIVGYGAPAKGNTLLNYCNIKNDLIDYTVDKNTFKQNLYLPGTHIPIFPPEKISETKPDYILILPWNLKDEIISQMSFVTNWGAKFIIPIPEITEFDPEKVLETV